MRTKGLMIGAALKELFAEDPSVKMALLQAVRDKIDEPSPSSD